MRGRVVYSRRPDAFRDVCERPALYIAPRARLAEIRPILSCPAIAVEDVTDTNTWLWVNEAVRDGTPVVYDRVSRYYKVGSEKSRRLSRLAEVAAVTMVDLVPFCEHRKFLYMTWRYVGREILGYAHFYAFSGDHGEELDGRIVHSLDEDLLCRKIAGHVVSCEPRTVGSRRTLPFIASATERAAYADKREHLFAKYGTPQPILTRLADLSHAFTSRRQVVADMLNADTAVICNMASYAKWYQHAVPQCSAGTYAKPPKRIGECRRVVFAEPPIITTYRRIDLEAMTANGAEVVSVVGDVKVDAFLHGRVSEELSGIDRFMEKLRARLSQQKCA